MRSIKTNIFFILFLFSGLFLIGLDKVEANDLELDDYTLQCIYSDGGLYTYSKNYGNDEFQSNRTSYNLSGVSTMDSTSTGVVNFLNSPADVQAIYKRCAKHVAVAVNKKEDTHLSYYKFFNEDNPNYRISTGELGGLSWHSWLWNNAEDDAREEASRNTKVYDLVSEMYLLNNSYTEPNVSLYYAQKATQAAGTDKYVEIMFYDNAVLLKSEKQTTFLENSSVFGSISKDGNGKIVGNPPSDIYLNNPEPTSIVDSVGNLSYAIEKDSHTYIVSTSSSGKNVTHYELTDEKVDLSGASNSELCDTIMPQTALVLKDIIRYAQLLVPVFLIILTAIDIGKIVVSGNIDEEMPKQKKKVITRFIIAVIFFFLPLLVRLTINMINQSGIKDPDGDVSHTISIIDCLFE